MTKIHDVVVVGSGPAGYTAGIYAARARLEPIVIEGSVTLGGALMNTTEVENYPGFSAGVDGPTLMLEMRAQAERFGARLVTDDAVEIDLRGEYPRVMDGSGAEYRSRSLILSMGSQYKELGLPNEKRLSGYGVSWCATCDGAFFADREVAVIGGGDSAMEEATFLTRFASRVYVVHRRRELRASRVMQERAQLDPKIEFVMNTDVVDVEGAELVSGLIVRDRASGAAMTLPIAGVFVAIGHSPRSELVRDQVECSGDGYVQVAHPSSRTNRVGVFAAGDLVDHTYRQAITAAGSGCRAAIDVEHYLAGLDQAAITGESLAEISLGDPAIADTVAV